MNKEQRLELAEALMAFVIKVARNSGTSTDAEVEALPRVAAVLAGLQPLPSK